MQGIRSGAPGTLNRGFARLRFSCRLEVLEPPVDDFADGYFVLHLTHLATRRKLSVGYDARGRLEPLDGFAADFPWRMHEQAVAAAALRRDRSAYVIDFVDLRWDSA